MIPVFEFGGIESPLIVTPVLSDDNYLGFSYWNISTSHLRVDAKELSNIKIKDKKHTGKNNSSELSCIIHGKTLMIACHTASLCRCSAHSDSPTHYFGGAVKNTEDIQCGWA